jgi:hypothetical protein
MEANFNPIPHDLAAYQRLVFDNRDLALCRFGLSLN